MTKKIVFVLLAAGAFSFLGAGRSFAVEMGPAAGVTEPVDKDNLEGWIIGVNYQKSMFRLLDPRGFQRVVTTKSGTIGDYHLGDKVRVEIDPDYERARSIEKIR